MSSNAYSHSDKSGIFTSAILPRYTWNEPDGGELTERGHQASALRLVQKVDGSSQVLPKVFICKYFSCANQTGDSIRGPAYVHREWKLLAGMNHPNIPRYEDFAYDPGGPNLARLYMEYCPGRDLRAFINDESSQVDNRLSISKGLQVLRQVAEALMYTHHGVWKSGSKLEASQNWAGGSNGLKDADQWHVILHRDIKPANIFVVTSTETNIIVKLGDFGVARFDSDDTHTQVGNLDFSAPEQKPSLNKNVRPSYKSDLYSLGATLQYIVKPDTDCRPKDVRQVHGADDMLKEIFIDLITRLCAHEPADRPSSVETVDQIERAVDRQSSGRTLLHDAVVNSVIGTNAADGSLKTVRNATLPWASAKILCTRLLQAGLDPDLPDQHGLNALQLATSLVDCLVPATQLRFAELAELFLQYRVYAPKTPSTLHGLARNAAQNMPSRNGLFDDALSLRPSQTLALPLLRPVPTQPFQEWIWDSHLQLFYYYQDGMRVYQEEPTYQDGSRHHPAQPYHWYGASKAPLGRTESEPGSPSSSIAMAPTNFRSMTPQHFPSSGSPRLDAAALSRGVGGANQHSEDMCVHAERIDNIQTFQNVFNPVSNVRTIAQVGPKHAITDPELYKAGVKARRMLHETPNEGKQLDPRFQQRKSKYFVVGRVFLILWAEPSSHSDGQTLVTDMEIHKGRFGQPIFHKVRRFVVIRSGEKHCTALPIMTYGGQGVAKRGVKKADHAIIYTGRDEPKPMPSELPQRDGDCMRPDSIRVDADEQGYKLDSASRVDFGKPHTVHHNIKVRNFGIVNGKSMRHLMYQFECVWADSRNLSSKGPGSGILNSPGIDAEAQLVPGLMQFGYTREEAEQILKSRNRQSKQPSNTASKKSKDRKANPSDAGDDEETGLPTDQ